MKGLGSFLNDVMGSTSAGAQSQRYNMMSAAVNNAYQKEFAKNAHQWEVADLEAAGLNPILSAGGSGATASGGGVSAANVSASGINPLETIINGIAGISNAKKTDAETKNIDADTINKGIQQQLFKIDLLIKSGSSKAQIEKAFKELNLLEAQIEKTKKETENTKEETKKKKGGRLAGELGTDIIEKAKEGAGEIFDNVTNKAKENWNKFKDIFKSPENSAKKENYKIRKPFGRNR